MKRAWKKVLSLVLTTSMVLSVLPTIAFAEGCEHECSIENGCITEECLHEHGEDCYQTVLSCGQEEHQHDADCIDCETEEHQHDADCYTEELDCDHVCTAESGCIVVDCLHECDEECGGLENVSTGGGTR